MTIARGGIREIRRVPGGSILAPADYVRWLSDEPDPHDLLRPYPVVPMRMWPISTRVNKPENDDPSILKPIELSAA
jgi:putative SOS response-associated peptidase YedK